MLPDAEPLARRLEAPLVGRKRELQQIEQALAYASENRSTYLVTVIGAPGVGKTRLAAELQRTVRDRAGVVIGRCRPAGQGTAWSPVAQMLRQVMSDPQFPVASELLKGEPDAEAIGNVITELASTEEIKAAPEEISWAVQRFLAALARRPALVVMFDDIHWAEPTLLDLIEHLAQWGRDEPLLLVCLARPELFGTRAHWGVGRFNSASIQLEALSRTECETLIADTPDAAELDARARERIIERAEGNPLFLEQMLALARDLHDSDEEIPTPPSIQVLLAARLDQLSPAERDVVCRAAVVGMEWSATAVGALLGNPDEPTLSASLRALVHTDLIEPATAKSSSRDAFRFRHTLIRDAAYETLPKRLRAELHERLAGWMEQRAGERLVRYAEIVGYHLEQAYRYQRELGSPGQEASSLGARAAERLARAGKPALARGDVIAAIELLGRAAALLREDDPFRLELLVETAGAFIERGEFEPAEELLSEVLELAEAAGNLRLRYHALLQRSRIAIAHGSSANQHRQLVTDAVQVFEDVGDELGLARAWMLLSLVEWILCRTQAAGAAAERALRHARTAGALREEEECLRWVISCCIDGPTPAADALSRCEALLAERPGRRRFEASSRAQQLSWLEAMHGRIEQARALYASGQEMLAELGLELEVASLRQSGGYVEMIAGNLATAESELRRGYEALEAMGEKSVLAGTAALLAQVLELQERTTEAEQFAEIARSSAPPDDLSAVAMSQAMQARLLARRKEHTEAERLAREALRMVESTDVFWLRAEVRLALADVLQAAGRDEEAIAMINAALALEEAKGDLASSGRTRKRLSAMQPPNPGQG